VKIGVSVDKCVRRSAGDSRKPAIAMSPSVVAAVGLPMAEAKSLKYPNAARQMVPVRSRCVTPRATSQAKWDLISRPAERRIDGSKRVQPRGREVRTPHVVGRDEQLDLGASCDHTLPTIGQQPADDVEISLA
jgi:hypothetical protein